MPRNGGRLGCLSAQPTSSTCSACQTSGKAVGIHWCRRWNSPGLATCSGAPAELTVLNWMSLENLGQGGRGASGWGWGWKWG